MIADNNPERRNLTVLSLAIIIFYAAGGAITKDDLHLEVINITFHNHHMLVVFVWAILFGFLFRYWITNKNTHGVLSLTSPYMTNMNYFYVKKYVDNYPDRRPRSGDRQSICSNLHTVRVLYFGQNWWLSVAANTGSPGNGVVLSGLVGYLMRLHYFVKIAVHHRAATDYYLPYTLFYWALFLGLKNSSIDVNVWDFTPLLLLAIVQCVYETR